LLLAAFLSWDNCEELSVTTTISAVNISADHLREQINRIAFAVVWGLARPFAGGSVLILFSEATDAPFCA